MSDALDVITLPEAKAALGGLKGARDDTELAVYITATSRALDKLVGAIVRRDVTERLDGGERFIQLLHPVSGFASITEYFGTTPNVLVLEAPGAVPGYGYLPDPHPTDTAPYSGLVWRRSGGWPWRFEPGQQNVVVTYCAGRYATTATVAPLFKAAAFQVLRGLWSTEEASVAPAGPLDRPAARPAPLVIPDAVVMLLGDEVRDPIQVG